MVGEGAQTWEKDEWLPEIITSYYGPAVWNPEVLVEGAREPLCNLNRIKGLQVVLKIIRNSCAERL